MSEAETKKVEEQPPKKGPPTLLLVLLPSLIAGGAAFGGAKLASAHGASTPVVEHISVALPPGPTLGLEPFVLVTPDASKKLHPMKVSLAVEFDERAKEETLKSFTPRVRDAALTYLRSLAYEDAVDYAKSDKVRSDLLEHFRSVGAVGASRVLITDLVVQ